MAAVLSPPLRMVGAGLVSRVCGCVSPLQVLLLAAAQGPGGLPTRRTRALRRALRMSCTRAACATWASVSVQMAGCSCSPSASARIWCIAKTGHRLGAVGVSAIRSGMASNCLPPGGGPREALPAGVRMVGMCFCSVRGLLDRRRGSVVDDVRLAWWSLGPPWPLSIPSLKTTRRTAGGGVQLRRRDRPEFLVSWRCSGVPPCIPEAWGLPGPLLGANGRRGLLYVPQGEHIPVGGPRGRSGELRRAACLGGSWTSWDRGRR